MSIAADLDQQYDAYVVKVHARHTVLRKTAANIAAGFVKHLGLGPNAWNRPDGKAGGRKVELGLGQGADFQETQWERLPASADGSVEFAISYMLAGSTGNYRLTFDCALRCLTEGYSISIKHVDQEIFLTPEEVSAQSFDALFGVMVKAISSRIDPDSVVIPQP